MYYAFKVNHNLPPTVENGFEKPQGKLYEFESREERRKFVDTTEHVVIISRSESKWLGSAR